LGFHRQSISAIFICYSARGATHSSSAVSFKWAAVINYYEILEINPSASASEIRAAYKRMAMLYHPDRNPGDKQAEERFKIANEAYHTLSDPLKKSRHDAQFNPEPLYVEADYHELNRQKYWRYRKAQQHGYVIDKNYFRIQGLAFLVFIVIAGFCFAVLNTAEYFIQQQRDKHYRANTMVLKQAGVLFSEGQFDDAFTVMYTLKQKDPLEYRINFMHDSLVRVLRNTADASFNTRDYKTAAEHYQVVKKHEQPQSFETIRQLSICQFYLGDYQEALQGMKRLHNQQPGSLDLVYSIGIINLDKLDNAEEALYYFSFGKKLFKENLSKVYGAAFEIIMDPNDAPDIYYDIFVGRARANIKLGKFEEAVTDCNWAIYLRQGNGECYKLRAEVNIAAGDLSTVCRDLRSARKNQVDTGELERKYCR
jgi:tetratricopeptide (TPR) repeat protein